MLLNTSIVEASKTKFITVDEYIDSLPPKAKKAVIEMRRIVRAAAPEAIEVISYNMPALKYHGMLLYYAAWKEHVGLYGSMGTLTKVFAKELSRYVFSKGTIQFPLDNPLPEKLIQKLVHFRVNENKEKGEAKRAAKK